MTTLTYLTRRAWAALDDLPGNHRLNFAVLGVALLLFASTVAVSAATGSLAGAALGVAGFAIAVAAGVDRWRIVRQVERRAALETSCRKALTAR